MAHDNERDLKQRSFGCIGVSMMAHVGVLAVLALSPQKTNEPFGLPQGNAEGQALIMDLESPGSAPGTGSGSEVVAVTEQANQPSEPAQPAQQLLADAKDATAIPVVLPEAKKEAQPEPAKEVKPLPPVEKAKPKPVAKAPAPKAKSPRKSKAAPAPVEETAAADGDVAIHAALSQSRVEPDKTESKAETSESNEAATTTDAASSEAPEEKPSRVVERVDAQATSEKTEAPDESSQPSEAPAAVAEDKTPVEQAPVEASAPAVETASEQANAPAQKTLSSETLVDAGQAAGTNARAAVPGHQGTGSGVATRRGGGSGYGIPLGVQIHEDGELREAANNRSPKYPMEDRQRGRTGTTVLIGQVLANGQVGDVKLEQSSGSPFMDQAAIEAYKKWRYIPGQEGYARKRFAFTLSGDAREKPALLRRIGR